MKPNASLKRTSNVGSLEDRLLKLQRKDVLIGIPQATASRPGEAINNAELLYLLSKGSQMQHIPPRPVLEPAIEAPDNKVNIAAELKQAAQAVLESRPEDATQYLELAGQVGSNAAVRWFTDPRNSWAPNAPQTIKR